MSSTVTQVWKLTVKLSGFNDQCVLPSLESNNWTERLELLARELVAFEESPVLSNGPSAALDLRSVPLDHLDSILHILTDRLLRQYVLSC